MYMCRKTGKTQKERTILCFNTFYKYCLMMNIQTKILFIQIITLFIQIINYWLLCLINYNTHKVVALLTYFS